MKKTLAFIAWFIIIAQCSFAQGKPAVAAKDDTFQRLLMYSAPGAKHALLGALAGNWNFQDQKRAFVKGTVTRRPIYEGRFYLVELTGGKLQIPVAEGKMKEANFASMQIEGYDNVTAKFVAISINNHIGSDIQTQTGTYDSTAGSFSYEWSSELLPGDKVTNRRILKIIDKDHYTEEFFELVNNAFEKVRQLDYTRSLPAAQK